MVSVLSVIVRIKGGREVVGFGGDIFMTVLISFHTISSFSVAFIAFDVLKVPTFCVCVFVFAVCYHLKVWFVVSFGVCFCCLLPLEGLVCCC